ECGVRLLDALDDRPRLVETGHHDRDIERRRPLRHKLPDNGSIVGDSFHRYSPDALTPSPSPNYWERGATTAWHTGSPLPVVGRGTGGEGVSHVTHGAFKASGPWRSGLRSPSARASARLPS